MTSGEPPQLPHRVELTASSNAARFRLPHYFGWYASVVACGVALVLVATFLVWRSGCARKTEAESKPNIGLEKQPQRSTKDVPSKAVETVEQGGQPVTANKNEEKASDDAAGNASQTGQDGRGSSARPSTAGRKADSASDVKALAQARQLFDRGREAAKAGDYAKAFRHTRGAWLKVKDHAADADCQSFASTMLKELDALAEKANAAYRGPSPGGLFGKRLKEQ